MLSQSERELLTDALDELFPDGLTTEEERQRHERGQNLSLNGHFKRRGRNGIDREALANEAAWLRMEGKSFAQIGRKLGISTMTASVYVKAIEPALHDSPDIARRGGRRPGFGRLSAKHLRALHRIYMDRGCSVMQLAREVWERFGYASPASANTCILTGWKRLGLDLRVDIPSRCEAIKVGTKGRRCRRPSMVGARFCHAHNPKNHAKMVAHAREMRAKSPLDIAHDAADERELIAA